MKRNFTFLFLFLACISNAQSQWPSTAWTGGDNLTSVMSATGVNDLSGLHWNPLTNRLYCVQGDGRLRILQMDSSAMGFTQIANKTLSDGPEGITQVNLSANEFYTIDENTYEIRKFTHNGAFGSLAESKHWSLLVSPSPMQDTGNTGPEGIVFIPDASLSAAGFISQQTGAAYTSLKGMGGLMFIAHQDEGYIWVFDVNPNTNNDFLYVGKYKTNRLESSDLAFDQSTGLLYILHNIDANYIETTNLASVVTSGSERKFVTSHEYFLPNPADGNINIEGFALMPKCPSGGITGAWLARDVETSEDDSVLQDCLRWFSPFTADGSCALSVHEADENQTQVFPNPGNSQITISSPKNIDSISIVNSLGQTVSRQNGFSQTLSLDTSALASGLYLLEIRTGQNVSFTKWLKI
ncbi:MAG: T9SS type A sorting domain-containing protein [Flavobacterium sp.]|nr:MAG: T9SS type A sorting domain-containing protein [Flavobacterium sp.]